MKNHVAAYRKMARMTQQELANIVGISGATLCKKENGKIEFRHSEMAKIKNAMESKLKKTVLFEDIFLP